MVTGMSAVGSVCVGRAMGMSVTGGGASPVIVGLGGTLRPGSSSERALRIALGAAAAAGAQTHRITAQDLAFEHYSPGIELSDAAQRLVSLLRGCDGLILSTPGYHGGVSGLLKNALDYVEELAGDDPAYLSDLPVGCITIARGNQAAVAALGNLRDIVHALRAFPTPYGAAIVSDSPDWLTAKVNDSLLLVGEQVARFGALIRSARHG
jgi:FMN reductase